MPKGMKAGETQLIVEIDRRLKTAAKIAAELDGGNLKAFVVAALRERLKKFPQVRALLNGKRKKR